MRIFRFPPAPRRAFSIAATLAAAGAACPLAHAQNLDFRDPSRGAGQQPPGIPEVQRPENPKRLPDAPRTAAADPLDAKAPDPETPSYLIGAFVIRYATEHPQYPALDDLMKARVTLGVVEGGYTKPAPGTPTATYTVEELSTQPPQRYTTLALFAVQRAVKEALEAQEVYAALVSPSESEFAPNDAGGPGEPQYLDQRPAGSTAVTLIVRTGVVGETRTIASGDRIPYEERINNPRHASILRDSPIQIFEADDPRREDVLRKNDLDDYIFRLNRHPGRQVDLAIGQGDREGELAADYLINENKPWTIYAQISNTGTEETSDWRERFGFSHNQLTGADDILAIDYVTAGFDESHFFGASYERPLWGRWLRGRVFGNFNQFTASDVGETGENFEGDGWAFGGELIANIFQRRELFLDVYAGARYQNVRTEGIDLDTTGEADFFLPDIGLRLERNTETSSLGAEAGVEFNLRDVADTPDNLDNLQRTDADSDFTIFHGDVSYSVYLEEFFQANRNQASTTLAHELAVAMRGQWAFDNRLIPNFQEVVGGLYTVRGYPESVVSGDSVIVGNLEYRFHLPQALGIESEPGTLFGQSFRYRPQTAYGRADWDLILKGFLDVGRTDTSGREGTETNDTLIGTGVGAEFQFRRNFNLRVDWGVALEEIEDEVSSGSNRFHISATILF